MSWQSYVDEHLMCDIEGHHLTGAAIIGQDGSVWAQSLSAGVGKLALFIRNLFSRRNDLGFSEFSSENVLKPEEVTNIMNDFNEPGTLAPIGLFIASAKYMVIQGEPGAVIRGKKSKSSFGSAPQWHAEEERTVKLCFFACVAAKIYTVFTRT